MAEMENMRRTAYLNCLIKSLEVTRPILLRKNTNSGSSKTTPKARSSFEAREKYSLILGKGRIASVANPRRNLKPYGKTTKYPKRAPPMKALPEQESPVYLYSLPTPYPRK